MERASPATAGDLGLGRLCLPHRLVGGDGDIAAEPRFDPLDPRKNGRRELDGRHRVRGDQRRHLGDRGLAEGIEIIHEKASHKYSLRAAGAGGGDAEAPPPLPNHAVPKSRKGRSEEHTSELQSLMRSSYAVFCLKKKNKKKQRRQKQTN